MDHLWSQGVQITEVPLYNEKTNYMQGEIKGSVQETAANINH